MNTVAWQVCSANLESDDVNRRLGSALRRRISYRVNTVALVSHNLNNKIRPTGHFLLRPLSHQKKLNHRPHLNYKHHPDSHHTMRVNIILLSIFILYSAFLLSTPTDPKMKKIRVNIAPAVGVQDREIHVDIRFDAHRDNIVGKTVDECIEHNCHAAQEVLKTQGVRGRWRANMAILDRVVDYYTKDGEK